MNTIKHNKPSPRRTAFTSGSHPAPGAMPPPARNCRRSGTTLILTLGILTVISVLAVTFLLSARLQKQSAATSRNRQAAEAALNTALAFAMQQIEDSLSYPNFTDQKIQSAQESQQHFQRMAPIGRWFSEEYARTNDINLDIAFQYNNVLTSPTHSTNSASINLLSSDVLALVPAALTNGLPLDISDMRPLRSGWIPTENLPEGAPLEWRLQHKPARIAYAVFNCSSAVDANVFPGKPTSEKKQRKFYSTTDVASVFKGGESEIGSYLQTNNVASVTEDNNPFFHTSYDPNPNTFRHQIGTDILGREAFSLLRPLDLNQLDLAQVVNALSSDALAYDKFNINNITNFLYANKPGAIWQNDPEFIANWFMPTEYILNICRQKEQDDQKLVFDHSKHLAWSIANFMDPDRIPDVSPFTGLSLPTRSNYAVEDVPLISKISLFKVMGPHDTTDGLNIGPQTGPDGDLNYNYYDIDPNLSNHYAVAVELWYPFAPNSPFDFKGTENHLDPTCYIGIYTNEADVVTTTNRPLSNTELENFFGTNIIMKVLFDTWARNYEQEVGWEYLDGNPIWQEIRNKGDFWFTPAMLDSPLWRETTDQGDEWFSVATTNSPLYRTFFPDTYEEISTNNTGIVTTNSYTYITQTNFWLNIASPGVTNEFIYGQYVDDQDYMVMYWENFITEAITNSITGEITNSITGAITNSILGGIINEFGDLIELSYTNNRATDILYGDTPDENYMISVNPTDGIVSTNFIAALLLSQEIEPLQFIAYTNIFNQARIDQVTPLYMPPEFKLALNEIFLMLPTNSIGSIFDFMLLTTDDVVHRKQWDELFNYLSNSPGIQFTIIPQIIEPSLGNMTEENKYWLDPDLSEFDPKTTTLTEPDKVNGYFWTIYPTQTVAFIEITEQIPPDGAADSEELVAVTNCYPLGATIPGNSEQNKIWIRPVTTVVGKDIMTVVDQEGQDRPWTDRIVDEAVMLAKGPKEPDTVQGWSSVINLYVADPRDNAYADRWIPFETPWDDENNNPEIHDGVQELPFIHLNTPLQTIGDLGHIYTEYKRLSKKDNTLASEGGSSPSSAVGKYDEQKIPLQEEPSDTIDFSMLSAASLLDFFTIKPNKPERGLVQANTTLEPTLAILFSDVMLGWTNSWQTETLEPLNQQPHNWVELWGNALTNDQINAGWRSFADMLPALATNEMHQFENVSGINKLTEKHNYTEDVLRGIIDKVSFRQNVFVIILAAQTLAPGSEQSENPTVLAEQRAAVTVIRDAYSGNWTIAEWRSVR